MGLIFETMLQRCAENRRCESSRVTSPYHRLGNYFLFESYCKFTRGKKIDIRCVGSGVKYHPPPVGQLS